MSSIGVVSVTAGAQAPLTGIPKVIQLLEESNALLRQLIDLLTVKLQ